MAKSLVEALAPSTAKWDFFRLEPSSQVRLLVVNNVAAATIARSSPGAIYTVNRP
jgi:hypothetical protein